MPRRAGLILTCLLLCCPPLAADSHGDAPAAAAETRGYPEIPFKQASEVGGETYLQVGLVLLLMLAVAGAVILLLKKLIVDKRVLPFSSSRIRLLEARRISSKLSVYLVEVDGSEYLLSQAGDSSHMMRHRAPAQAAAEAAE